jgi:hypothetical protein
MQKVPLLVGGFCPRAASRDAVSRSWSEVLVRVRVRTAAGDRAVRGGGVRERSWLFPHRKEGTAMSLLTILIIVVIVLLILAIFGRGRMGRGRV